MTHQVSVDEDAFMQWALCQFFSLVSKCHRVAGTGAITVLTFQSLFAKVNVNTTLWLVGLYYIISSRILRTRSCWNVFQGVPKVYGFYVIHIVPLVIATHSIFRSFPIADQIVRAQRLVPIRCQTQEFALHCFLSQHGPLSGKLSHILFLVILVRWCLLCFAQEAQVVLSDILIGVFVSALNSYTAHAQASRARLLFNFLHQRERILQRSASFDASVRAMIGNLFQASCICDESGRILQSTEAFDQFSEHPASDSNSRNIADSFEDRRRLLNFLATQVPVAGRRAQPFHVTLMPSTPDDCAKVCGIPATLFCIRLGEETGIFVGVSVSGSESKGHCVRHDILGAVSSDKNNPDLLSPQFLSFRAACMQQQLQWFVTFGGVASLVFFLLTYCNATDSFLDLLPSSLCGLLCFCLLSSQGTNKEHFHISREAAQIVLSWLLHASSATLALSLQNPISRHRAFLVSHTIGSISIASLIAVPPWAYGFVLLGQVASYYGFHCAVHYVIVPSAALGLFIAGGCCYCRWIFECQMLEICAASQQMAATAARVSEHASTLQEIRDSLFDGSCFCDIRAPHEVVSATPHWIHSLGTDIKTMPLMIIGYAIEDKQRIASMLDQVCGAQEDFGLPSALRINVCLCGHETHRDAHLFAVVQPNFGPDDILSSTVFIGLQLVSNMDVASQEFADTTFSWAQHVDNEVLHIRDMESVSQQADWADQLITAKGWANQLHDDSATM